MNLKEVGCGSESKEDELSIKHVNLQVVEPLAGIAGSKNDKIIIYY